MIHTCIKTCVRLLLTMSDVYVQEPATAGKVLFKTTKGDIIVELWSRECPKTCRNFIQLCLEGYYNGCIFHRVIKDFIVQTGDPTGSGVGGESVYGQVFADEFHSRLKFRYRGMLGMASIGNDMNGSQFFITLSKQEMLNGKNTLFGKIVGDSIYTVNAIGELEVDKNDRPDRPPSVLSVEVLDNPFSDIIPRKRDLPKHEAISRKIAPKRTGILSFMDDDQQEEYVIHASFDTIQKMWPDTANDSTHACVHKTHVDTENDSTCVDKAHDEGACVDNLHVDSATTCVEPHAHEVDQSIRDELAALQAQFSEKMNPTVQKRPIVVEESVGMEEKLKGWQSKVARSGNWLAGGLRFAIDSKSAYEIDQQKKS